MQYQFKRWPTDDEELWWCVQALWGIRIPRTQVCANHVAPFTAFANAFFARDPVALWVGSRGFSGKSMTLACLTNTEAVILGSEATLLGGSASQSLNVHNHSTEMWAAPNAPRHMLNGEPTKFDTFLRNGSHIRALMASQRSVRGAHPQRLRLDEIDEMDLTIAEAAQGQPMRKANQDGVTIETQTVMSSTHQNPNGTLTEMLKRANESGWPIYQWCYKETSNPIDGWLAPSEVERQRGIIPAHMWRTEYELQEPSIEGRAIDTDAVEDAFDSRLGECDSNTDKFTIRGGEPRSGTVYVTGIDWAKEKDWTVVSTFDTSADPWVCVAWRKMGRMPWPVMIRAAVLQWTLYGGYMIHDQTGLGNVINDQIVSEVPYGLRSMMSGVMMVGRDREALFNEYIAGIESRQVKFPRMEFPYKEHLFCTNDDLFAGGKTGHPPDSFVSGALAWRMRRKLARTDIVAPSGGSRAASPWN